MQSRKAPRGAHRRWREAILIIVLVFGFYLIGRTNLHASADASAAVICASNMRTILREAAFFSAGPGQQSIGVDALQQAGIVSRRLGRCPLGSGAGPDYLVTYVDGRPVKVVCTAAHGELASGSPEAGAPARPPAPDAP